MSIVTSYRNCMTAFQRLFEALQGHESGELPATLRKDVGRFRVWAENSGAHRRDRMSLEYRLREASGVKQMVIKLLGDIHTNVEEAIIIASSNAGSVTTSNRVPPKSTVDENADSTTFATLPNTQEPEELSSDSEEIDELEDCLLTVSNVITCLYNFSIAIRNPAPRDRLEKCATIDVSHHEKFDIDHTSNKFPNAAEYLTRRLGEANTKRRQLLKYHELHHNKIAGRRSPEQTQGSYVRARDMPQQYHELEIEGSMYETGTNTETTTATTVSTYVPQDSRETNSIFYPIDLDFDSRSEGNISETSFGSNLSSGESNSLQVPSPPDPESAFGGVPFECPLCWSMIKISDRQSWRRHIFQDLRPYICTFEGCINSGHMYESRHLWFEHECVMHRREWYCSLHGPFSTSAKFQQHLLSDHSDLDSMAQSRVVVDRAERTIQSEQSCPMCGKEHLSPRGLRTHLGRHMQQVALFVLPGSVQEEDESGSVSSDSEVHRSQETVEALEVQAREPIRGTVQVLTVLFFQIRDVLETFRDVIRRLESYNEESENSISLGDFHGDISEALRELRMENALLETRITYILSDLFPAKQVQALMSGEGWDELEIQADLNQSTQPGHANLLSKELLSLHSSLEEIVDLFKSEDYRKNRKGQSRNIIGTLFGQKTSWKECGPLINDVIKRNCRLQVAVATLAIPQRRNARPLQWKLTRNHDILDSCEGLFVDMEGSWQPMWPPALDSTTYLPQKVSLDNLLHQDAMGRSRRLRLAVQIANTMMYLHGTEWLGNTWGKCDIFFRSRPVGKRYSIVNFRQPDLDKPFFYRRPHSVRNIQGAAGMNSPLLQINKTLFSLGIILIELWFGKRLEDFPDNLRFPAGIERTNNTEYLIAIAQHLLGTVGNDARLLYGDVVRRCILGLDLSRPALENQDYKREVYTEVVSELERSWKTFVGRDERVGETKAAGVD